MQFEPPKTPRRRPFLLLVIGFALILGALASFTTYRQSMALSSLLLAQTESLTKNIAALSHDDVAANDRAALAIRLEGLNEFNDLRSVSITDRQGHPLAAVIRNAAGNLSAAQTTQIGLIGTPSGINSDHAMSLPETGTLVQWHAIGEIAPIGWVRAEFSTHAATEKRKQILLDTFVAAAVAWTLAVAALLLFLRSSQPNTDQSE